eukprot:TRINITY_DN9471_c2_g1_i1.p1 TRINITY_DN9471_c2_g1~~TRINITY_DN9471_c2_g1_i1.p1  ORF type:complete len:136 (+),score=4.29 TRINITY_DN9471_c2_g1_i1:280-687(+)
MNESSKWAIFGKQNWRCGINRKLTQGAQLCTNLDPTKGVDSYKQQDGGHGSRNPLRSVQQLTCRMDQPRKWMALKCMAYSQPWKQVRSFHEQEGVEVVAQPWVQTWVKRLLVQILVVVANIQMRTLKTEVEKGSM